MAGITHDDLSKYGITHDDLSDVGVNSLQNVNNNNDNKYLYQSYDNLIELDINDLANSPHTYIEVEF